MVDDMKRIRLLNLMIDKLKIRSLVDRVYISPSSSASEPFNKRDQKPREELMAEITSNGNTQDLLSYIADKEKKIVLVAIDHAGLSTNCEDIKSFLSTYESIKEIAIDLAASKNKTRMYNSQELVNDEKKLKEFERRRKCLQRSKFGALLKSFSP